MSYWWMKHLVGILFFLLPGVASAQQKDLRQEIKSIIASVHGRAGVAVVGPVSLDTLTFLGNIPLPMQSVYKFPLAMAILDQIDKGKWTLAHTIHLTKKDLFPDTYSPLRDKYPDANVDVTLEEILQFTVSQSDNNGCDVLFRLIGGPDQVEKYVRSLGVGAMNVKTTEEEMHRDWMAQYSNSSTPVAMAQLLGIFFQGKSLSRSSNDLLWKWMVEATTGTDKIRGMLPPGTVVAHKTGASSTNEKGIIGAANDAGIVTLPSGRHFTIVVFISDTSDKAPECAAVIARISRAVWDYYSFLRN